MRGFMIMRLLAVLLTVTYTHAGCKPTTSSKFKNANSGFAIGNLRMWNFFDRSPVSVSGIGISFEVPSFSEFFSKSVPENRRAQPDKNRPFIGEKKSFSSARNSGGQAPLAVRTGDQTKISETFKSAEAFFKDVQNLEKQVDEESDAISEKSQTQYSADENRVEDAIQEHNARVNQTTSRFNASSSGSVSGSEIQRTSPYSVEGQKIASARQYQSYVSGQVALDTSASRQPRQRLVEFASESLTLADVAYSENSIPQGDRAVSIGLRALDIAVGFVPGIGLAIDIESLLTGINPVTKEELSDEDYAITAVTLFAPEALQHGIKYGAKFLRHMQAVPGKAVLAKRVMRGIQKIDEAFGEIKAGLGNGLDRLFQSAAGHRVLNAKLHGVEAQADGSFKKFAPGAALGNPLPSDGVYAMAVDKKFIKPILEGKGRLTRASESHAWITTAADLQGVRKGETAKRLGLYQDAAGTIEKDVSNYAVVEFKFTTTLPGLSSPIATSGSSRTHGWIPGGQTSGGAREWLVDGDAAINGLIDLGSIRVRELPE